MSSAPVRVTTPDPVVESETPLVQQGRLLNADPGLLTKWSTEDERKLKEAQAHIEMVQKRRNMALQAVDEALSRAGVSPDLRDALITSATDIRAALAPFDVKLP
jgi:3-oxoacyl-[acyl-carrier-protein] synthase III